MTSDTGTDTIVVADPDQWSLATTLRTLHGAGHDAIGVARGDEAIEAAHRFKPYLLLLEIDLPGICGYEVCRRLKDEYGEGVSIVFVSAVRTESFDRVAGILLGADDYLCKPVAEDELLARIGRLVKRPAARMGANLTPRERDVLRLLAQGLTQREIADHLTISSKTVGTHTEHIFSKLEVRNRLQAATLAHRYRLVEP